MTASARSAGPLLEVKGLRTHFFTQDGTVKAVDGVTFEIGHGQTLGVVGESGCGKSITSLSVMRLIERPGRIVDGEIALNGDDLLKASDEEMRDIRGDQVSMIFQEPMTSLNPVFTCGEQISEAVQQHTAASSREGMDRAIEMLSVVGIPDPKRRAHEYPHQLSGGMRQRVMIAMALSTDPDLLIADEPTTALDVTIQAQILDLMRKLKEKTGAAIVLITHDLGVVAEMAQRVVVMYAGRKVEEAPVQALFANPRHPYTRGLLNSVPRLTEAGAPGRKRLAEIAGMVPSLRDELVGCAFAARCGYASARCRGEYPPLEEKAPGHLAACWESARVSATLV
jgi:peptide/nickel transport system ATP-binding protein